FVDQAGTVRRDLIPPVERADQIDPPPQQPHRVIAAKGEPVERIRIADIPVRRMDGGPVAETIAMPSAAERLDGGVLGLQPFPKFRLRCLAKTFLRVAFVP